MTISTNPTPLSPKILFLNDGHSVSGGFYDQIKQHVQGRLPALSRCKAMSLKQICCPTLWNLLPVGDRIIAGRCVANMVINGELPLIESPQKQQYPKKYCRI